VSDPPVGCIGIGPQHVPCPRRLHCDRHWTLRRAGPDAGPRVWYLCQTPDLERFEDVRHAPV
jgi:hypothetical protein